MAKKKLTKGLKYYKDARGKWRWRVVGDNNEIVGASSQGFVDKGRAIDNAFMLGVIQKWGGDSQ